MNAARTLLCLLLLAAAGAVSAQTTKSDAEQDDKNSPLYWLILAEKETAEIDDRDIRQSILPHLIGCYDKLGRTELAISCFKAENDRGLAISPDLCWTICLILADEEKYDEALRIAKGLQDEEERFYQISIIAGCMVENGNNIKDAMETVKDLPSEFRDAVYTDAVQYAAFRNDFEAAGKYLALIKDDIGKNISESYIKLAKLIKDHGSIEAVLKDAPDELKTIEYGLDDVASACIEKGKLDTAAKIAAFIQDYEYQSGAYADIAIWWHRKGDKTKYADFMKKAMASAMKEDDPELLTECLAYIADNQVIAGDTKNSAKTVQTLVETAKKTRLYMEMNHDELVGLLLDVGKDKKAAEIAAAAEGDMRLKVISKYIEHYTRTGDDKSRDKYIAGLTKPEQLAAAYTGIAESLIKLQKEKEAKKKASTIKNP